MDNKFSQFFNKYGFVELIHRSYSESTFLQSRRISSLGKAVIEFSAIYHVCAKNNLIDDKDLTNVSRSLRNYLYELIYQNFPLNESFLRIKVGNGLTKEEIGTDRFVLEAFNLYIGNITVSNSFQAVLKDICSLFPQQICLGNGDDPKTTLQEFLQKRKMLPPTYLTDDGQKVDGTTYKYTTYLNISDMDVKVVGVGSSKKKSQKDAASKACERLNLSNGKVYIPLSKRSFDFTGNNKSLKKKQINPYFYEIFDFNDDCNILPAFIHQRMKSNGLRSHRRFAMLGADLLQVFKVFALYKNDSLNVDEQDRLNSIYSYDFFLKQVKKDGFFRIETFPYYDKGGEYQHDAYNIDCIQALYGLSFIFYLEKYSSQTISELVTATRAFEWFWRMLERPKSELDGSTYVVKKLLKELQSIKVGFTINGSDKSWSFLLSSLVNKKDQYEVNLNLGLDEYDKVQVKIHLSEFILKTLYRINGSNPSLPKTSQYTDKIRDLSTFLIRSSDNDFKPTEDLISHINKMNNYANSLSLEYLIEIVDIASQDVDKYIYIYNILLKKKLLDETVKCLDFLRFNNQNFTFAHQANSVEYVFNAQTNIIQRGLNKPEILESQEDITNSTKGTNSSDHMMVDGKGRLKNKQSMRSTNEDLITENQPVQDMEDFDANGNFTDNSPIISPKHSALTNTMLLPERIKYFHSLNNGELKEIWSRKEDFFIFAEDAAVVLSLIRLNEGIDRVIRPYTDLINFDIITRLDLPSLASKESNKIIEFKIDRKDTRIKKTGVMVVRPKQANFRAELIKLWKCCPITGCDILDILDAAHIYPYRGEKDNQISNGILLRTDIHKLFDRYLLSINPTSFTVYLSKTITDPHYTQYNGKVLKNCDGLSLEALRYHWMYFENPNF